MLKTIERQSSSQTRQSINQTGTQLLIVKIGIGHDQILRATGNNACRFYKGGESQRTQQVDNVIQVQ